MSIHILAILMIGCLILGMFVGGIIFSKWIKKAEKDMLDNINEDLDPFNYG